MPEFPAVIELSSLTRADGFEIVGSSDFDRAGHSVSSAGDINGDGFDDIVIGSNNRSLYEPGNGVAWVVFGSASRFPATLDLANLKAGAGFTVRGAAEFDALGDFVSDAGDVNGDGIDDVILGALGADPGGNFSGAAYVIYGKTTGFAANLNVASLTRKTGLKIIGEDAGDYAGIAVSAAGDVNGDGIGDLVIGARGVGTAPSYAGAAYVVFGTRKGFGATLDLGSLDGTTGFQINGAVANDQTGLSAAGAGDVNGDGFDDVIVGAQGSDVTADDAGAAYVVFGAAAGFAANVSAPSLNGSNGFRIHGAAEDSFTGYSVSTAGDINGDGRDDLIVGAWREDSNGERSGSSYVVFGKAAFAATLQLSAITASQGFEIRGENANDFSGYSVSDAGDVNGDGFADIIVGSPRTDANGDNSGSAYVVFGRTSGFGARLDLSKLNGNNGFEIRGESDSDVAGEAVSGAGDINNDGFDDILVGAPGGAGDTLKGSTYVIYGHRPTGTVVRIGTDGGQTINGGKGADRIDGRGGNDILIGWEGNDTIGGGTGNDRLEGGIGGDRLAGSAGRDIFDYDAIADSKLSGPGRDLITGFNAQAADRIDLSTIDAVAGGINNRFVFKGDDAFTGRGQVLFYEQGANTIVEVNTTGTRAADMRIVLAGHILLDANDFIL